MVGGVPDVRVQRAAAAPGDDEEPVRLASSDSPLLATALARSFELVAGIAFVTLVTTAIVVMLVPRSASARVGFAVELVAVGIALMLLALLLSRRSAQAVMQPLEILDAALAAITAGDLTVRVRLERAAAEIQFVGESVNTMVRELARLRLVELERTKDERVRRELSEVVHSSLDLDHVVQRAVEVVGAALDVDRVHIRLLDHGAGLLVAEWLRSDDIASVRPIAPTDELAPLVHLISGTDDENAVVIDDARDLARFTGEQLRAFDRLGIRAALTYPILVGAQIAGVIVASDQIARRPWSDSEVSLMQGFAREIGRALDHAVAFQLQDEMVERLGVLDRAKNEFLAEVSRELRGPLASVLGYIELLTDESADTVTEEQRRMLNIVERNGEQLLVLIDDLLTMSRIEAGTFAPKLLPIHLSDILRRVGDGARTAAADGFVDLEVDFERDLDGMGDETQIERALDNLMSNAVKFTPAGGRVELLARSIGDEIVIDVRDTGVGIANDELGEDRLIAKVLDVERPAV